MHARIPLIILLLAGASACAQPEQVLTLPPAQMPTFGDPLMPLSDDFSDPASLSAWTLRHVTEGAAAPYDVLDVSATSYGVLTVDPSSYVDPVPTDAGQGPAWFQDRKGTFLHKTLSGDFALQVGLQVGTVVDMNTAPDGAFNTGGILVRSPSSFDPGLSPDLGDEAWVVYNLGTQAGFTGTELKTTFPDGPDGDPDSDSTLFLQPTTGASGQLIVCRVGDAFHFYRRLQGDAAWTEEVADPANLYYNGANLVGPDYGATGFTRPDMAGEVQVGLMTNRWSDGAGDPPRIQFDHATFWRPTSVAGCTGDEPPAPGAGLDDDFEDAATLSNWTLRAAVESDPPHHDTFDIDGIRPGFLTLDPNGYSDPALGDGGSGPAWFQDRKSPYPYKEVSGDFAVMVDLQVGTVADIATAPAGIFNSGGLVLRDPLSFDPADPTALGGEGWVAYNIGRQAGTLASETKTTFPDGPDGDLESDSSFFLTPITTLSGRLVACRIGDEFRFFRSLDGDGGVWTEEVQTAGNLFINNAGLSGPDYHAQGFIRPDLGDTLQVGILANRWADGGGSPMRVQVDEIRFAVPATFLDCTAAFE